MENTIRFGTCSKDCYGSCVFNGIWNDKAPEEKFLLAKPRKNHPFTNGFFCPKYNRRQDLVYHPERLREPLIRAGAKPANKFESISSQKALDVIANKIKEVIDNGNAKSIIGAFYAGNSGLLSMNTPLRFFREFGATITKGGICNEGGCAGLKQLFGTYSISNPFQINDPATRLIVIWGSNLSESNNHAYFLVKQAIRNGVKLIVVDSRRTQIAKISNTFLHIFPGTENLLVKLLVKIFIERNLCDVKFLKKHVDSYHSLYSKSSDIDEIKALTQIGISSKVFNEFVTLLDEFKHHTLFLLGYGIQKDFYGGRIVQTIALVQVLLGNIGKHGTGLIYSQSAFLKPKIQPLLDYITNKTTKSALNNVPLIDLGNALSSGKYKILFVYNFNPASSLPNQNKLREALSNKDLYIVVLDMFLNETTKYADIIIPVKFDLEVSDLILPYYIPSLSINIKGPCPYPDCMSNYEFFQQLFWKIGYKNSPSLRETEENIFSRCLKMLPRKIFKKLTSKGYYLLHTPREIPFKNLKFPTPNKKIQVNDLRFNFGQKELKLRSTRDVNEFMLISPSHFHFLHSQLGILNSYYREDFKKVFLNIEDIKAIDSKPGEEVVVSNEYGSASYVLDELKSLKSGTALIYSGGPTYLHKDSNVNMFTPDIPEELGHSGSYNSALIQITKQN
ncbi:MAG: molybdopterin-dependent oxidoreductase [Promethearchaeota archaeon]|jgi:anaerobic selenocysteine-containing dehydrogenase